MTFSTSIQSLVGAHSGGAGIAVNWSRLTTWESSATNVSKYDLISGLELGYIPSASIPARQTNGPIGLAANGDCFVTANQTLNAGGMAQIDATSFTVVGGFGYPSGNEGQGGFTGVTEGLHQFIVERGLGGGVIPALGRVLEMSTTTFLAEQDFVHLDYAQVCAGPLGTGIAYIMSSVSSGGSEVSLSIIQCAFGFTPTNTVIGVILPSDVDATWSNIALDGLCLDQTDGKILAVVWKAGGTGAIDAYLIKVNPTTAAVEWVSASGLKGNTGGNLQVRNTFQFSDVRHQRIAFYTPSPNKITIFDTSDGSVVDTYTSGLAGISYDAGQCYSDTLGGIILKCGFVQTTGSPTLLNATPSSFSGFTVLYVAAAILPPIATGTHASYTRIWGNYHV